MQTLCQSTTPLIDAAALGDVDAVVRLLDSSDFQAEDHAAVRVAVDNGHLQCTQALIAAYGPHIWRYASLFTELLQSAVDKGHAECVRILLPHCDEWRLTHMSGLVVWPAERGHTDVLRVLVSAGVGSAGNISALVNAARNGHTECVKLLIPHSDPKAEDSRALRAAAEYGRVECVKLLIAVSEPKDDDSVALIGAATHGHAEVVALLIPVSDPKARDSEALRKAAILGWVDIVQQLIPVSDPKANNSQAWRGAVQQRQWRCVDALWDVSDVQASWEVLAQDLASQPDIWQDILARAAQRERDVLADQVDDTMGVVGRKNKI